MKAIQANVVDRHTQWHVDLAGDTAENRLEARMLLRELGAVRFSYHTAYCLTRDQVILRVTGRDS